VTQRTPEDQSSATLQTRSDHFSTSSRGMSQNPDHVEATPGCECSAHLEYPKPGSLFSGLLLVLAMSLLLTEKVPQPAFSGLLIAMCSTVALVLVSVTARKHLRERLALAGDTRTSFDCGSQLQLGATILLYESGCYRSGRSASSEFTSTCHLLAQTLAR